jgi:FkbM family methyltransferase
MAINPVPTCGSSDQRNQEYLVNYSPEKYYQSLVTTPAPIIFDVGAHRGESVRFFREIFPGSKIYSFEPDPDNFKYLDDVCQSLTSQASVGEGSCLAFNLGVAETEGTLPFYRQSISHLGGLLPINYKSQDSLGYAAKAPNQLIEIEVTTVDRFCHGQGIKAIDILKIDVQGYEIGVLTGANQILKQTSCCTVEVSLYDFYEGSTSLLQVEQLMQQSGHRLWDISKVSKNPRNFRTDWVELVYRNHVLK